MWLGRSDDVLTACTQAPLGPSQLGRGSNGGAGAMGGAIYTTASVASNWAGAMMNRLQNSENIKGYGWTDGPTNGWTQ